MSVVAVIPARGGSKGIPRKNLAVLHGRPLLSYSIVEALQAKLLTHVLVSTDDPEIAAVSAEFGAQVPFLRPLNLSGDDTPMLDVLRHALHWSQAHLGSVRAVALLQPTSPFRCARHIDEAVSCFISESPDSVVSVVEVPHHYNPVSVLKLEHGFLKPFLDDRPQILRRQDKPRVLARNGPAVLVTASATLERGELYGSRCLPYFMSLEDSLDIDTTDDLAHAEAVMALVKRRGR